MTEAMPFLQKYDITFLRPPTIWRGDFFWLLPGSRSSFPAKHPPPRFIRCRPEMLPQPLTLSCESCNLLEASFFL